MSHKQFRFEEISQHATESDMWIVIHGKVYDVTKFADEHPGGVDTLLAVAAKDGSVDFDAIGHSDSAKEDLKKYYIGDIHPEDKEKLQSGTQVAGSSYSGLAVVFVIVAIIAFFILRP